MEGVPGRFTAHCEFCNRELDTRQNGVHQWTCGWVMQRSGGGGHGISLAQRSNRWAHQQCIERRIRGQSQQPSMFDLPSTHPTK